MTCRHAPGDPNCTSTFRQTQVVSTTPDAKNYFITGMLRVGRHVVLKVKYPNCVKCAYEGEKVMVYLNLSEEQLILWREIDPHFRAEKPSQPTQAPSPNARFPASTEGWTDAVAYANTKPPHNRGS